MAKLTLNNITSGHASTTLQNANNAALVAAIENTLSRDGTTPNGMSANLDMNSNRILNLLDAVNAQEPVTYAQLLAAGTATIFDSSISSYTNSATGAVSRTVGGKLDDIVSVMDFQATGDGVTDDATPLNNALSCGARIIDGAGKTYAIDSAVTIPTNVELRNCKIVATTAGINMLLINNYSKISKVHCVGTGTVSTIERAVYPAVDGVYGCQIDVEVSNITFGVHLQPLTSVAPSMNYLNVFAHDIVGTTGDSEGYGVLCSPANDNVIILRAKNIKRHALYLSAGASRNHGIINVDTCYNHAVTMYATSAQSACEDNTVFVKAVNLQNASGATTFAVAASVSQKCNRNEIHVECYSDGNTDRAFEALGVSSTGPFPTDNVVYMKASGTFLAAQIGYSTDCDNTMFIDPVIDGKSTTALIQFNDTASYSPKRAGSVRGGSLDGQDSSNYGVSIGCTYGVVEVGGSITFANVANKVKDYTGQRVGFNKMYTTSHTFTNVADAGSDNQAITFTESFENEIVWAQVTSATSFSKDLVPVISATSATGATVYIYNNSGGLQASVTVSIWVTGD